jgi:hypothetical protein
MSEIMAILYSQNNIADDKQYDSFRKPAETCYPGFPCSIHTYNQSLLSLGYRSWYAGYFKQAFSGYAPNVKGAVRNDPVFRLYGLFWNGAAGGIFYETIRI